MKIYEVEYGDYGSYEAGYTIYFDSKQKAVDYCKSKGFYGKDVPGYFKSPFVGKMMLKVGDLLLDVTDKWIGLVDCVGRTIRQQRNQISDIHIKI